MKSCSLLKFTKNHRNDGEAVDNDRHVFARCQSMIVLCMEESPAAWPGAHCSPGSSWRMRAGPWSGTILDAQQIMSRVIRPDWDLVL